MSEEPHKFSMALRQLGGVHAASGDLLAVAKAYEQWEADLLLSNEAWRDSTAAYPTLTESLWDRLLEIQAVRNAAVARAEGRR